MDPQGRTVSKPPAGFFSHATKGQTMDNVVYVLGAGFSAPLGLPTMGDFWEKAKKMEREQPEKYGHFRNILDLMKEIGSTGNYFEYVPFNIEEAMSILEMRGTLGDGLTISEFGKFISEVIVHHTPPEPSVQIDRLPSNWERGVFGNRQHFALYGPFVASLFGLQLAEDRRDYGQRQFWVDKVPNRKASYAIVSLNYDMVLENFSAHFRRFLNRNGVPLSFQQDEDNSSKEETAPPLVKIHGSVSQGEIIPPTFNKGLYQPQLPKQWRRGYDVLMKAHQIRIVGYSLPQTDAYIKYLLKAAIGKLGSLEQIDVLCKNGDGNVKKRYAEFVRFKNFRYVDGDVVDYLKFHFDIVKKRNGDTLRYDKLEDAHSQFMRAHASG